LEYEVEAGIPLAVPAQFVRTRFERFGESEGYYAPDLDWSGGIPTKIMLNPVLGSKLEKRFTPEQIRTWFEEELEILKREK
jgi:hypothetical protein